MGFLNTKAISRQPWRTKIKSKRPQQLYIMTIIIIIIIIIIIVKFSSLNLLHKQCYHKQPLNSSTVTKLKHIYIHRSSLTLRGIVVLVLILPNQMDKKMLFWFLLLKLSWNDAPFFTLFAEKQWISKDIPSYGSQSKFLKIAIHWFGKY